MKFIKSILPIAVVLLLSYWVIKPLFITGFFPIHDDTQVARVFEMTKSLKDGIFPVRWVSDLGYGYGYPIFNFYAPLAYYVGALFQLLSFDALSATKLMMGTGIILSGAFMYLLGKEFWGKLAGVVSAAFYLYAPYHAVDIYVRGDVAEFWAYAFIPLAFLAFYKVYKNRGSFRWVVVGAFSYAGIILSHNLTAMMVTPFLLAVIGILSWNCLRIKKKTIAYALVGTFTLGLCLSAFYFVPALLEQKYTNVLSQIGGGADFKNHFVCPLQLWQSQWGYGGSVPGCNDGLSFMIGKIHLLSVLAALIIEAALLFRKKIKRNSEQIKIIALSFLGLLTAVLIMLPISEPLWKALPFMAFLQYPWRFLIMASFFTAFIAGSLVFFSKLIFANKHLEYLVFGFLILLVMVMYVKFFTPQTIFGKNVSEYVNLDVLRWTTSKISDEYMPRDFPKPTDSKDVVNQVVIFNNQDIKINSQYQNTKVIRLNFVAAKQTKVHFNIAHFPSWKLTVDGSNKGSIVSRGYDASIAPGSHTIEMKFVQSGVEKISNAVSIAGLLAIIAGIILSKKKVIYG